MAVYKRPGKSSFYWCRFTFDGREIRRSTGTANKQDAKTFEADLISNLHRGSIGLHDLQKKKKGEKCLIFKDAMKDYLDSVRVKESTKRRYESASKALLAFFGNAIVKSIEKTDIDRYTTQRLNDKVKAPHRKLKKDNKAKTDKVITPATVNRELMLMSGMFNSLLESKKISSIPKITKLDENNLQNRVVSLQEFRAYLMACPQPLRDVASIMWETGMRPSEVFGLTKDQLDFNEARIRITEGKTDAARRRLSMSDNVRRILLDRCEKAAGEFIFAGGRKGDKDAPLVKLTNSHNKAVKDSKVKPFRLYDLRHSFATHLTNSGVDLVTIGAILGHSRLEMLKRYSHPTEQHQADAITRLENYRNQDTNVKAFRKSA